MGGQVYESDTPAAAATAVEDKPAEKSLREKLHDAVDHLFDEDAIERG